MEHDTHHRPLTRMVAVVAAGAVMLATPSLVQPKPPTQLTSPRTSDQVVALVAYPEALALAPRAAAAASPDEIISTVFEATLGRVLAGAASGFLVGFFGGGALALQAFGRIPVVGTPIVQAIAITAGIVGVPIGAIAGALAIVASVVSNLRSMLAPPASARKSAAPTPHRPTQPGARSNRDAAKPSARSVRKAAGPQQRSDTAKAGSGRDRDAAAKRAGRH
jgi:hypothetical protein